MGHVKRAVWRSRTLAIGLLVVGLVGAATLGLVINGLGQGTSAATPTPRFVEEAAPAGLDHIYDGDFTFFVGGGLATFDCNDDGRPDLYLAGGHKPAALFRNESPLGGALRFSRLSDPVTDLGDVMGAYPLDIDGDGHVDLAVLRAGQSVLLRGLGGCRFERANEAWSFDGGYALVAAFSATWEASARLPTLAVGTYLGLDAGGETTDSCGDNVLIRPDASGVAYGTPFVLTPGYCALSMLFSDWDRSGRRDLRISNDRHYYDKTVGQEQLWRIATGEAPRLYTAADGWVEVQIEGMGIASYDVTGDGYPDVYLTSQGASRLQTLTGGSGQPTYGDIGAKRGVNATRPFAGGDVLPSTAWHPEFDDVNNDGLIDLFVSKGNVKDLPDYAAKDPSNLLLGKPDGTFGEAADTAGILSYSLGRGASLTDFNLDGLLDLVEVNLGDPVKLWRNLGMGAPGAPTQTGGWLAVRVRQSAPNLDAIGAWLEVRVGDTTARREIVVGGGHASGELGWTHLGLGAAAGADLRVQWPDGEVGPWQHVEANGFFVIERGAADPQRWIPPQH